MQHHRIKQLALANQIRPACPCLARFRRNLPRVFNITVSLAFISLLVQPYFEQTLPDQKNVCHSINPPNCLFFRLIRKPVKIIIKGDRNVGKSCLLERLQGRGFIETYTPSEEINVASIQWSFKATEDIVKVEVWDVVDRGRARARPSGLKIIGRAPAPETPALDAEFLDVYKGTHGVILMMDITKNWTFDYVCKELPKIPSDIPVLLLGNHCDMSHHRAISQGQAMGLIEELGR